MGHVSYTDLRQNLARYLDEAVESRAPLLVTRQNGKGDVVMLSAEEFAGWQDGPPAQQSAQRREADAVDPPARSKSG